MCIKGTTIWSWNQQLLLRQILTIAFINIYTSLQMIEYFSQLCHPLLKSFLNIFSMFEFKKISSVNAFPVGWSLAGCNTSSSCAWSLFLPYPHSFLDNPLHHIPAKLFPFDLLAMSLSRTILANEIMLRTAASFEKKDSLDLTLLTFVRAHCLKKLW